MDITLTMKQKKRIEIIERVLRNDRTVIEAAMVSCLSERHSYPIKAGVKDHGIQGCSMAIEAGPVNTSSRIRLSSGWWSVARGRYRRFNDHHLTQKLKEEEKIEMSRQKVRRVLRSHGMGSPRNRRANKHRSRREHSCAMRQDDDCRAYRTDLTSLIIHPDINLTKCSSFPILLLRILPWPVKVSPT